MAVNHSIAETLRNVRHRLHRIPETGFELDKTKAVLIELLTEAGFTPQDIGGGLVVDIGDGDHRILLRTDMDALPIQDIKDIPYQSTHAGKCHACGHDGHMAMLFGAALLFKERGARNSVRLMFQPAEECPPGGAADMIKAGVLDGVAAAFALHLNPHLKFGQLGLKAGPMMAATDNFKLTILGKSGHGAMPHQAADAILAAGHTITALQALVSRLTDPLDPVVLSVGKINGGMAANVVSDTVLMEGTIRTLSAKLRNKMPGKIQNISNHICKAFNCRSVLDYSLGYPVLMNNPVMAVKVADAATATIGKNNVKWLEKPVMGGEDFAYILHNVPGMFCFLGTGDAAHTYSLHHPRFDFNEDILMTGSELYYSFVNRISM